MVRENGAWGTEVGALIASLLLIGSVAIVAAPTASADYHWILDEAYDTCEQAADEVPKGPRKVECPDGVYHPCSREEIHCDAVKSLDLLVLENSFVDGSDCHKSGTRYASGTVDGKYDWCLEVDGRCSISTHAQTETKTEWWTIILVGEVKTTTTASTQTTIDCEGDWAMAFTHYGGLGIREAVTTHETSDSSVEKESCRYIGTGPVLTDQCTTAFSGQWEVHKTVDGEADDWEFCKGAWSVHNAPVVSLEGLLTSSGTVSPCWWASSFISAQVNVI